jgi:hypothetical protein
MAGDMNCANCHKFSSLESPTGNAGSQLVRIREIRVCVFGLVLRVRQSDGARSSATPNECLPVQRQSKARGARPPLARCSMAVKVLRPVGLTQARRRRRRSRCVGVNSCVFDLRTIRARAF